MVNLSGTSKDSSHLIVSFSFSEDPGDGWWVYSFDDVADRSDAWFDKVDFSITDNELMVSGILRDTNNVFSESVVLLFDKYVGYMGQNLNYCFVWDFINEPGEEIWGVSPIQYEETGIASRWMIASSLAGGDTIKLIEFTGDCGTPDFDVLPIHLQFLPINLVQMLLNPAPEPYCQLEIARCKMPSCLMILCITFTTTS